MTHEYPSERQNFADSHTGAPIIQWTRGPHRNQHLYFTSPSVTADNQWLVFISDRDGSPNLYAIHRPTGNIRRLSYNQNGLLRSYVYPEGGFQGLSKASPCLDVRQNKLFYIQDDCVYVAGLDEPVAKERMLCTLPSKWMGAFAHISPDGATLCVPCTDPGAFADDSKTQREQLYRVPLRMEREHLVSHIYLIDTSTGSHEKVVEVPFWVTHVQFDPRGSGRLLFNLEGLIDGTATPLPNRIWCMETDGSYRPLAPEGATEWRTHENWAPSGGTIVYHGCRDERPFVAARTWDGELIREFDMSGIAIHHTTATLDGRRFFADCHDGFIAVIDPEGKSVTNLCRHDTSIEYQDAHAHPIITPDGSGLIFTSDRAGNCNVYEVCLSPKPALSV